MRGANIPCHWEIEFVSLASALCIEHDPANLFIAFDLFKRNYSWPKPLRGIGVRGADLCPADCAVQLGFFSNEEKREKLEHIDKAVDTLRQRYGYRSVQRAVVYTDPVLGGINAYDDHNIHPVGYFHTA